MPRPKGSPNKITTEVKEQLQSLIDEVVNSIDVNLMDTNQKLKLLQLSLHYVLPKLRSNETIELFSLLYYEESCNASFLNNFLDLFIFYWISNSSCHLHHRSV